MVNLPELLKNEISSGLPGVEAHIKMAPMSRIVDQNYEEIKKTAKHSGVLILIFKKNNTWFTMLMERNIYNGHHSGQISFPGGRKEKYDFGLKETALREFEEEMGVKLSPDSVIGELSEMYIPPSNFYVKPFVAYSNAEINFIPEEKEVNSLLPLSVDCLLNPIAKTTEKVVVSGSNISIKVPAYNFDGKIIWGATAMMLSELEYLLKRIDF